MPETAILNDKNTWDNDIQDNPCPDYGFTRKRPNTRVTGKAPGGQPFSREAANNGYTFQLSWLNRSYACVQRVKQFAEQYEDGYFTIVDRDGGGREYVGHFTGECNLVDAANDSWDIRDLTFEEVPGAPMRNYPNDWLRDSVAMYPFDDYGRQRTSTSGSWTSPLANGHRMLTSAGNNATDFLGMEYRGYGCQVWMLQGPDNGHVALSIDGGPETTLDLYAPAAISPQLVFQRVGMPTDLHRVRIRTLGAKNDASTGAAVNWVKLQVMR